MKRHFVGLLPSIQAGGLITELAVYPVEVRPGNSQSGGRQEFLPIAGTFGKTR